MNLTTSATDDQHEENGPKITWHTMGSEKILLPVAVGLFIVQAAVLIGMSIVLYTHFDLTKDFMEFYQGWFLIAKGHLNPYLTSVGVHFWQNHLEWIMWPLALFYFIYPHGVTLLVLQDLGTLGAEVAAFGLMRDIVKNQPAAQRDNLWWVTWVGLLLLVFNPWVYVANIFDFHFHTIEAFFVTAAVWQFYRHHVRWGYLFVALCFVTSDVSVTYLVAVGILLLFWRQWRDGVVVGLLGLLGFIVEQHFFYHGVGGLGISLPTVAETSRSHSAATAASPLVSLLQLPRAGLSLFWSERMNWYANLGPTGLIGVLSPVGLLIPGLVLFEASLGGTQFFQPGWAVASAYALLAVGTVAVLVWTARRSLRVGQVLGGLVLANLVGWAVVGLAGLPFRTTVPTAAATRTLQHLRQTIPATAEVVASQGVIGRFAARENVHLFWSSIPVESTPIYFIVSPYQGIEVSSPAEELARIIYLENHLHAHLIADRGSIWAFRWTPPKNVHVLSVPDTANVLPAWPLETMVGHRTLSGSATQWHLSADGPDAGYVMNGAYWRLSMGTYQASVSLKTNGPINVEVWNDTGNFLLARRTVPATHGIVTLTIPFILSRQFPRNLHPGTGPFRYQPVVSTSANNIEVRVWTPGHEKVAVYNVGITGE